MSEEKKYGISKFDIAYDPNTFMPTRTKYAIREWNRGGVPNLYNEVADEPLTYSEAQALLKLLEERHE